MNNINNISEENDELLNMLEDTQNLFAEISVYNQVENLTTNIEFNRWLSQNFPKNFPNTKIIKKQALDNTNWIKLQFQGKGYEFDYMTYRRGRIQDLFSKFDAGTNPTQVGIDVTQKNIFTNEIENTYQHKAYISRNNPKLKTTPKDTIVVVPPEKVEAVKNKGYKVEEFMTREEILKKRETRLNDALNGKVEVNYNLKNVTSTMGKAGLSGFIIGIGWETVISYKKWKNKEITTEEYIQEVLKTGAQLGINSGITAGLMIPVSAELTILGYSKLINIPVGICISVGLDKILSPIFKKGEYQECLAKAKYYQNITNFYNDFKTSIEFSHIAFIQYINKIREQFITIENLNISIKKQKEEYNKLKLDSKEIYKMI